MVALRKNEYQHPDYRQQAIDLIEYATDQAHIVTFPMEFLGLLDNQHEAAILLNQILYWSSRTSNAEGWFYKSYDDWQNEIGLSRYKVQRALGGDSRSAKKHRTLREIGVETCVRKAPNGNPTVHYRIDVPVFMGCLEAHLEGRIDPLPSRAKRHIVAEPSVTESQNEMQQSRTSSLSKDSQSKDNQTENHPRDERLSLVFSPYEKNFGKIEKIPVETQAMLIQELERIGTQNTKATLERCCAYGKSWHYVLTALKNESSAENSKNAAPEKSRFNWSDYIKPADDDDDTPISELRIMQRNPLSDIVCEPTDRLEQTWEQSFDGQYTIAKVWQITRQQLESSLGSHAVNYCLTLVDLMDFDAESNTFTLMSSSPYAVDYAIRLHRNFERTLSDIFSVEAKIRVVDKGTWVQEHDLMPDLV